MQAQVFIVGALVCCAISQVNASPVRENGRNQPKSYTEMGDFHLSLISPDGFEHILKPSEVLSLKSQMKKNAEEMIFYKLIDEKGFAHLLTDHQMERMLDFNVIAIVSRDISDLLKRPGFGHRMVILEKDGTLKSFIYNLPLLEAVKQLPQDYPYNFSTSKHAYHNAFQHSKPTKLDFHF